jgi:hypothetical protein
MTPVVILALDSRTPTCFLSPPVLIRTFPSRLLDYGRSEGGLAHYSRGGSYPQSPRPRHRLRPSEQPGAVLADQRHRNIHHSYQELVRPGHLE